MSTYARAFPLLRASTSPRKCTNNSLGDDFEKVELAQGDNSTTVGIAMENDIEKLEHDTEAQSSRLFALPRELRDKIYDGAACKTDISPSSWEQSELVVEDHLPPALLRVNKQMRDECGSYNCTNAKIVTTFQPHRDDVNDLHGSLRKISPAILKSIYGCLIMVPPSVIGELGAPIDRMAFQFHMNNPQGCDQTELLWTPSKGKK